jgi:lysozyme
MRSYTPDECRVLLQARQASNYAPAVLKCVPSLALRAQPFAASVDAAYNAGVKAFCGSPMARKFNAGDWAGGCAAFSGWYVRGGGRVLPGLIRRREAERALCAKGAA